MLKMRIFFFSTAFVDEIIRGNVIYKSYYQLMVIMGKYLPQKGKVCDKNSCLKALIIFSDLSLLRQIFPHINHKLMK